MFFKKQEKKWVCRGEMESVQFGSFRLKFGLVSFSTDSSKSYYS